MSIGLPARSVYRLLLCTGYPGFVHLLCTSTFVYGITGTGSLLSVTQRVIRVHKFCVPVPGVPVLVLRVLVDYEYSYTTRVY